MHKWATFSGDGSRLLRSGPDEGGAELCDASGAVVATHALPEIDLVALDRTGAQAVVAPLGRAPVLHRLATGEALPLLEPMRGQRFKSAAFHGDLVAVGGTGRTAWVFHAETGAPLQRLSLAAEGLSRYDVVASLRFSGDGKKLAAASDDRVFWEWDVASGKVLQMGIDHTRHLAEMLSLEPCGDGVSWAFSDGRAWRCGFDESVPPTTCKAPPICGRGLTLGPSVERVETHNDEVVLDLVRPDGERSRRVVPLRFECPRDDQLLLLGRGRLAVAQSYNAIELWDLNTGTRLAHQQAGDPPPLAWRDGGIEVLFSPDGLPLMQLAHGHLWRICQVVAVSSGGERALVPAAGGAAVVSLTRPVRRLREVKLNGPMLAAVFLPDGRPCIYAEPGQVLTLES